MSLALARDIDDADTRQTRFVARGAGHKAAMNRSMASLFLTD
jgi:hypothetical protein